MKERLNSVLSKGVTFYSTSEERRSVYVLNQFLMLAFICIAASMITNAIIDTSFISLYYGIPSLIVLAAVAALNISGYLYAAMVLLFVSLNVLVGVFTVGLGIRGLAYLYFFPMMLVQMFMFSNERVASIFYFLFGMTVFSGIATVWYALTHPPFTHALFLEIAHTSPYLNLSLCFIMTGYMVMAFMRMQRQREKHLQVMVSDKQTLLSEVHHRVKNNLAIISSLLNLQKNSVEDAAVQRALDDSRNRIYTMALIHEKLYKNQTFSSIGFFDYADSLLREYIRSSLKTRISPQIRIDGISLVLGQAIPCGLILNELITNSIKHGFRERKEGEISIGMFRESGRIVFEYSDNGNGVSDIQKLKEQETLGMTIVYSLAEQLGGTPEFHGETGFRFKLSFPEEFEKNLPA
ncbi:MAG: sensor histidine kinase [Bacteroidia bacterium]|nr:sensor histidine kinase [Bacteroidia bacterium]